MKNLEQVLKLFKKKKKSLLSFEACNNVLVALSKT